MKLKVVIGIVLLLVVVMVSCQSEQSLEFGRYYSAGSLLYQNRCQNCHGQHGEGLQALIPPLTDSVFIKKNLSLLPYVVRNGLKGTLTINNKEFEGAMPSNDLAPIELANVLTYVANSFGNKVGTVSVDMVNKDLANCK